MENVLKYLFWMCRIMLVYFCKSVIWLATLVANNSLIDGSSRICVSLSHFLKLPSLHIFLWYFLPVKSHFSRGDRIYAYTAAQILIQHFCVFFFKAGIFQVNSLHWHPDGHSILLLSKDRMCLCFLTPSESWPLQRTLTVVFNCVNIDESYTESISRYLFSEVGIYVAILTWTGIQYATFLNSWS